MSQQDYARTTWADFYCRMEGYRQSLLNQWQQTRILAYHTYLTIPLAEGFKHSSIYDFMPLECDPTEEQRAKNEEQRKRMEAKEGNVYMKRLLKKYAKKGIFFNGRYDKLNPKTKEEADMYSMAMDAEANYGYKFNFEAEPTKTTITNTDQTQTTDNP